MDTHAKIAELVRSGLSTDQATIYVLLLTRGKLTASKLQPFTSLSRPMVYRVLDELITFSLVAKEEQPKMVTRFECTHPLKLREFIDAKRSEFTSKQQALENVLSHLISDYTALSGKPGVRLLQGVAGIDELYEDILNENKNLYLIRSPYDDHFPELLTRVLQQIKLQVKQGIHTKAITPFDNETTEELEVTDPQNLVTRRLVTIEQLDVPAQVIMYGDKVAITAFDKELMTTIIQNSAISTTFRLMFDFMWQALEASDATLRANLKAGAISAPRPR